MAKVGERLVCGRCGARVSVTVAGEDVIRCCGEPMEGQTVGEASQQPVE